VDRAEQPALIRSAMAALAARWTSPPGEDLAQTLTAVYDALRTGRPYRRWLLVFDTPTSPKTSRRSCPTRAGTS